MNKSKEITDDTFEMEVLRSDTPCVVDFRAEWCQSCKTLEPVLGQLQTTFGDKVKFKQLNVEHNPGTPGKFGIRSIPALLFCSRGNVSQILIGTQPKSVIEKALKALLQK